MTRRLNIHCKMLKICISRSFQSRLHEQTSKLEIWGGHWSLPAQKSEFEPIRQDQDPLYRFRPNKLEPLQVRQITCYIDHKH
jgi:hypothetical protein